MPNPVESLGYIGYIKYYSLSSPRLVKSLAIPWEITFRRSAVDQENLKLHWKSEKKPYFSWWSTIIIYNFVKAFTNHRKKANRLIVFSSRPFFQHSKIQGPSMRLSNNLENKTPSDSYWRVELVFGISDSQFFRMTNGI